MYFRFKLSSELQGTMILDTAPLGWDKIVFTLERDRNTHGVIFEATRLNLEFTCGAGKEFIEREEELYGIDAEVSFIVEVVCNCDIVEVGGSYSDDYSDDYETGGVGSDCDYEELFTGRLEFDTYESNNDYVSIGVEQAGIHKTVETRMDTKIDLTKLETLDGTALTAFDYGPYDLTLHSKKIIFKSYYSHLDFSEQITPDPSIDTIYVELPVVADSDEIGLTYPVTAPYLHNIDGATNGNIDFFFRNDTDRAIELSLTLNLIGTLTIQSPYNTTFNLALVLTNGNGFIGGTPTPVHDFGSKSIFGGSGLNQSININYSNTITVSPNNSLWITFVLANYDNSNTNPLPSTISTNFSTCSISLVEESVTDPTPCKAFAVYEAGARIAQAITNQTDAFRSELFGRKNAQPYAESENGCLSFMAITNGALIRNFPIENEIDSDGNIIAGRPVRISLNEFFNGLNPIGNLGMGIEREGAVYRIRIDKKEFFYQDEVLFQLQRVPGIKISTDIDYYHNNLNVGYETWENEEVNGLDEFNTKRQYNAGIKNVYSGINSTSGLIAGGYAIEFTRRKQYNESFTEDWKYDNNNFIICLNRSVSGFGDPIALNVAEKNENFPTVNNLISPETSYNLRISPARNLLRWSNVINPGLKKYPGRELKFTYGEGNYVMESVQSDSCSGCYNNQLLSEGQDIQHDSVNNTDNTPIWEPKIIEFKYPLTFAQFRQLRDNPYKCIEISKTDTDFIKGYILEAFFQPLGGMTEFKLLKAWSE